MSLGDGMVSAIIGYSIVIIIQKLFKRFGFFDKFGLHEHVMLTTASSANVSIMYSGGFSQYILAMSPKLQEANDLGLPEDTWDPGT